MVLCPEPPPPIKPPRITEQAGDTKFDSLNLERRTRVRTIERHRSCEVSQVILSEVELDGFPPRHQGVMPASFKVHHSNPTKKTESLPADFGEIAIGRVAPVDSGLWWIILLRAYTKWTKDNSLAESPYCQRAMRLILKLWLSEGFDTSPALLCADGCSMIDRRMVNIASKAENIAGTFEFCRYMSFKGTFTKRQENRAQLTALFLYCRLKMALAAENESALTKVPFYAVV